MDLHTQAVVVLCLLISMPLICIGLLLILGTIAAPVSASRILFQDAVGMGLFLLGVLVYDHAKR